MALDNLLERLNNGEFDNCFSDHTSNGTLSNYRFNRERECDKIER